MGDNRRHILLINKRFQVKLIALFIVLNVLIMIVFGFFMYLFLDNELHGKLHTIHTTYRNVKAMLFPIVITLSVINLIISSIFTGFFILLASFRIAGPLYRFNQALQSLLEGKLSPLTSIRDGDQLNECSHTLGELARTLKTDFEYLEGLLSPLIDESPTEDSPLRDSDKIKEALSVIRKYRKT